MSNYKRITEWKEEWDAWVADATKSELIKHLAELEDKMEQGELVSKDWHDEQIAHAENTIKEYQDKFENGRAFELPCNVGDTVWFINTRATLLLAENTVYEGRVVRFHVLNFPKPHGTSVCADIQIRNKQGTTEFPDVKDFGKIWFLSKKEADARLEEIKKGDNENAINTWQ